MYYLYKIILISAILFPAIVFSQQSMVSIETKPKEFAENICQIIIKSDKKAFEKLIIVNEDIHKLTRSFLEYYRKHENYGKNKVINSEIERLERDKKTISDPRNMLTLRNRIINSFAQLFIDAKKEGVDLSKAKCEVKSIKLDMEYYDQERQIAAKKLKLGNSYDIYLLIKTNGNQYKIHLPAVMDFHRGYFLMAGIYWKNILYKSRKKLS